MATVSALPRTNRITLTSDSAGPFEVGFRLFAADALDVYVDGITRTDFTVNATFVNGYDDNATILFTSALEEGMAIQIDGALTPARQDDYINGPGLTALMNIELGRVWAALSEINRKVGTAVRGFDQIDPIDGIEGIPSVDRIARDYVGPNSTALLAALKITSAQSVRFADAYRWGYGSGIKWYFPLAAMTLVPGAFTQAERQACVAAAINKGVVGPRANSSSYTAGTLVTFPSQKIFYCNLAGTSAGSAPSDAGVVTAGSFLVDGTVTWEFTGLTAPATWTWFLLDFQDDLFTPQWPDSNDAYAGMLASAAQMANVDATWLNAASAHPGQSRMAVINAVISNNMTDELNGSSPGARLARTFQNGLAGDGSAYTFRLMADNVEVWRGYEAQVALLTTVGSSTTAAAQNAADVRLGILGLMSGGRFQTYDGQASADPTHLEISGNDYFVSDFRFHLWPVLHGMLETVDEWQTYGAAVFNYTVENVPGLTTQSMDGFPLGEWYAAAIDHLGWEAGKEVLAWRITSRVLGAVTIVDAALGVR